MPKLSSSLPLMLARPVPRAMRKGTVMGPVVTPPESKATARKALGTKMDRTNTRMYRTIRLRLRDTLNRVRSMEATRNSPTPTATERMITMSGTAGTWRASTWRSGSATVTMAPRKKQTAATPTSLIFPPPNIRPIWSPMGIMAMSAPREKNPMPTISMPAPSRNSSSVPMGMGASVKLSTSMMTVMGSTEERDSAIFSFSFLLIHAPHFFRMLF